MRTILYGKKAANLYTQAFVQNTQARALYQESEDTYYRANDAASYDDWRRARHQWDYYPFSYRASSGSYLPEGEGRGGATCEALIRASEYT